MRGPEGWSRRGFLGGSLAALALGRSARADGSFTLSNATVVLHDGQRLANAGVRVEAGRLVEVGTSVKGGTDLAGAWLVPGFTDAGCTLGLVEVSLEAATVDLSEKSDAVTPDARVWDGYNPLSDLIAVARVNGVTGALVHTRRRPGSSPVRRRCCA
jgi:imidazolonepropionase-like amidohydrolase